MGTYMLFIGARRLLRRNPELSWKRVAGVVLESSIEAIKNPQFFGNVGHELKVRYKYEVDGSRFEGDRIAPMYRAHFLRHTALKHAQQYPLGASVNVYANPENPTKAVLEPWQQWEKAIAFCIIGLALLGVAWAVYVASPSAS